MIEKGMVKRSRLAIRNRHDKIIIIITTQRGKKDFPRV
jgi:hypothetical protein